MNSVVLPQSHLPGVRFAKPRHSLPIPRNASSRKSFISGGVGLVLSMAFCWALLNKGLFSMESPRIQFPPDQAIYQWDGFYRVALDAHP